MVFRIHINNTEGRGQFQRLANTGDGQVETGFHMLVHHLGEVHAVDIVCSGYEHNIGPFIIDDVHGLVNGIRTSGEPPLAAPLLGGNRGHIIAQEVGHTPGSRNMAVQRMRLVLGKHDDLEISRIHDVTQRKVNQPVNAPERNRGFRSIFSERH